MVYAENISRNETVLAREYPAEDGSITRLDHKLNKSMGPVLLQHGDCLYFSKSTFVRYSERDPDDDFNMSFIMDCEVKVGCTRAHNLSPGAHPINSVSKRSLQSTLASLALVAKARCLLLGIAKLGSKSLAKLSLWLA